MRHLKNSFLLFLAGLAVIVTSCKKDTLNTSDGGPTQPTPTFSNANAVALLNNLATPLETYTINAANYHSFTCTNGTMINIFPNAFLTQSGAAVTGVVTIEVKDILSKKDMILNNAMPISNGQLLVSGGEVYFNATQNGQKLKMNPASYVNMKVPTGIAPSNQMLEFYSLGSSNLATTNLNWETVTDSITNPIAVTTTTAGGFGSYYDFNCDSVTWTNCDYFYSTPGAKTTCTVNLTGSFDNSNTVVFMAMNGVNTMAKINSASYTATSQSFVSYNNSMPEGVSYTVVAISFDGTNYYYTSQVITLTTDMIINLPILTQRTKAQIQTNLNTLP